MTNSIISLLIVMLDCLCANSKKCCTFLILAVNMQHLFKINGIVNVSKLHKCDLKSKHYGAQTVQHFSYFTALLSDIWKHCGNSCECSYTFATRRDNQYTRYRMSRRQTVLCEETVGSLKGADPQSLDGALG